MNNPFLVKEVDAALANEAARLDGEAEREREWRQSALFHFLTNTGSAYPDFLRAVRNRYRATSWADMTDTLVQRHWREALGPGDEDEPPKAPTVAEVLVLTSALEAYYRQHVAEFDPQEKPRV
jgi:hypothetical protein